MRGQIKRERHQARPVYLSNTHTHTHTHTHMNLMYNYPSLLLAWPNTHAEYIQKRRRDLCWRWSDQIYYSHHFQSRSTILVKMGKNNNVDCLSLIEIRILFCMLAPKKIISSWLLDGCDHPSSFSIGSERDCDSLVSRQICWWSPRKSLFLSYSDWLTYNTKSFSQQLNWIFEMKKKKKKPNFIVISSHWTQIY